RARVLRVPVRLPGRTAPGGDAGDLHRRLRVGVPGHRLSARLGHRDDHGGGDARGRRAGVAVAVPDVPRRDGRQGLMRGIAARPGTWLVWGVVVFFLLNLFALVAAVVVNSF